MTKESQAQFQLVLNKLEKAYENLNYKKGDFPKSEYLAEHCVTLPMFAELSDNEVDRVISAINIFNG